MPRIPSRALTALLVAAGLALQAGPAGALNIYFFRRSQTPVLPGDLALGRFWLPGKKKPAKPVKPGKPGGVIQPGKFPADLIVPKKKKPPKIDPGKIPKIPIPGDITTSPGSVEPGDETTGEDVYDEFYYDEFYYEEEWVELPSEEEWGYSEEYTLEEGAPDATAGEATAAPAGGGQSSLPALEAATGPGRVHVSLRPSIYDQGIRGDEARSVRDRLEGYLTESMISYDGATDGGAKVSGQIASRYTDDHEIYGGGANKFRLEGQFLEASHEARYLARVGDVVPAFSRYSFQHNGQGVQLSKSFAGRHGGTQVSLIAAQVKREQGPGTYRRLATGVRAAQVFKMGGGAQATLGGQMVALRDAEGSFTEPPAVAALVNDAIESVDLTIDQPEGVHVETEWARSNGELSLAGTHTERSGWAHRELVGYARKGKSISFEHERLSSTFDSPESGATPDVDRRGVTLALPLGERVSITGSFARTHNDIASLEGRTVRNETSRAGIATRPFHDSTSRWLKGLTVGTAVQFGRNHSSDGTTERTNREWTHSVGQAIGRLNLSGELRDSDDLDFVSITNNRAPRHWAYQASYEIPGGRNDHWRLRPTLSLGHDRDRNLFLGSLDRASSTSVGLTGNFGPRSTFSLSREDSIQRQAEFMRTAYSPAYRGEWNLQLDAAGNLQTTLQYTNQEYFDSGQLPLEEERIQLALYGRW
jgi:hypothetical protein